LKRPEGAAIYAGLHWTSQLLRQFPCTHPRVGQTPALPVYANNNDLLKDLKQNLEDQTPTFAHLCLDCDIIQGICTLCAQLPINTVFSDVKGHQDRQHPFANLSPVVQINILADQHASAIHQKQAITLAYSQHGSQELELLCTVVHIPSLRIYLPISVQQHTPLQCKNT
jgi:hypothetical protein